MNTPKLLIGVDGGGTRARALLLSGHGDELARVTGGAGWVDPAHPEHAAVAVHSLCLELLDQAQARAPVDALCCGLAGAGSTVVQQGIAARLQAAGIARQVSVVSDAAAAMFDAFGDGPGVLVVAGTGSIAWARGAAPAGDAVRVGGWGHILGDRGSGYAIALDALRAIAAAEDGVAGPTRLTAAVLERLDLAEPRALIRWVAGMHKGAVAALAPDVFACAASGDVTAATIIADAVDALTALAVVGARRVGLHEPAADGRAAGGVALHGGLIAPGGPLRETVLERLANVLPHLTPLDSAVDGARGAAGLALRAARLSAAGMHP